MKKILFLFVSIAMAMSSLYAQENCLKITEANLRPGDQTQTITLEFAGVTNIQYTAKYSIEYALYKNGELMTQTDFQNEFDASRTDFTHNFFNNSSYYGHGILSPSGNLPNTYYTRGGGSMSRFAFNFLYGKYLKTTGVKIRLNLGWKGDINYQGNTYKLVVKLVEMENGIDNNWTYNGGSTKIGGYASTKKDPEVAIIADTVPTIKYRDTKIIDTLCFSEIPYTVGRTTITSDTINKPGYVQPQGSIFYSHFLIHDVIFGRPADACAARIDSISNVEFYVWPELTLTKAGSGNIENICASSKAGKILVTPTGGKSPYTIIAFNANNVPVDTITINTSGVTDTIKGLEVGTYTMMCTDAAGCSATLSNVTIAQLTNANTYNIAFENTNILCYGKSTGEIATTVTINQGTAQEPYTYAWAGPDSYTATTKDISELKAGQYTVTVTDLVGCTATKQTTLTQNDALTSKDTIYCCANQLVNGVRYKTTDTIFYAAGNKDVVVTASNGCDSTITVTLISYNNPTVTISGESSVCKDAELRLTTASGMSEYNWVYEGATLVGEATTDTIILKWSTDGEKTVSVNYKDEHNCRATGDTTKSITVNALPEKNVTTKVNNVDSTMTITACAGDNIVLAAVAGYNYQWKKVNGGDLATTQELTLNNVTTNDNGKYIVTITNATTSCNITSDTITITVNAPAVTVISMNDVTICKGGQTTLTATTASVTGALTYAWTPETGLSATNISNPTATPIDTTTYKVVVTATVGACSVKDSATVKVSVDAPAVELNTISDVTICNGNNTQLNVTTTTSKGELTYAWTPGTGLSATGVANPTANPTDTITYQVIVTATVGSCSVKDTTTAKVNVNSPAVSLTPMTDATICKGDTTQLNATISSSKGDITYAWTPTTGLSATNISNPKAYPTVTTDYSVIATATIGSCEAKAYDTVKVTVNAPAVTLNPITGTSTICNGGNSPLTVTTASLTGTITYIWYDTTRSNVGTDATINVSPTDTNTYTVIATAEVNDNGVSCTVKDSAKFTVNVNSPVVALDTINGVRTICKGSSTQLTAVVNSAYKGTVTYLWSNSSTTDTITVMPTSDASYTVTATATVGEGQNACQATSTKSVSITVNAPAIEMAAVTGTSSICLGGNSQLTASTESQTGAVTYVWTPNATLTPVQTVSDGSIVTATPTTAGDITYKVVGTALVNTNSVSCTAKDSITFTLTANDTVTLSATNLAQTVCKDADIDTIVITNTNSTITTSQLPAGLTFNTQTNKIYGAPTTLTGGNVTITATSDKTPQCSAKNVIFTLTVNPLVSISANNDTTQSFCLGTQLTSIDITYENCTLSATGLPTGVTLNDGTISGTPTTAGTYKYVVRATSNQTPACKSDSITGTITVNDTVKLTIAQGGKDQTFCLGNALTDIVVDSANCTLGVTNLPAGVTMTNGTIAGTPSEYGTFNYTITATSDQTPACSQKTINGIITVNDTVKLTIAQGDKDQTFCLGNALTDIVVDSANCTLGVSGLPAGVSMVNGVISGTPTGNGTFNYTITATSDKTPACSQKTINGTITVNDTVKLTITSGDKDQAICLGNALANIVVDSANCILGVSGLPAGVSMVNGVISGTPTGNGTFDYTITATSNQNPACSQKTINGTITVNDTVKLTFSGDTTQTVCNGTAIRSIVFTASNANVTFSGNLPTGISYNAETKTISGTPTANGTFHYKLVANSTATPACTADSITGTIVVDTLPVPTLTNSDICVSTSEINDTLTLTTDADMTNYTWSLDGATTIGATSESTIKAQWATTGTKNISVTYTNGKGCVGTKNATVTVNEIPSFTITGTDADNEICADAKDTLSVSNGNYASYTWKPLAHLTDVNPAEQNKKVYANTTAGTEKVYLTIQTSNGCQKTDSIAITVNELPVIDSIIGMNPKCYGGNDGNATSYVTHGHTPYVYDWSNDTHGPAYNPTLSAGKYELTVTDNKGCKAIDSVKLVDPAQLTATISDSVNVDCHGSSTGKFTVTGQGGTTFNGGKYIYRMDGTEDATAVSKEYTNLAAGTYTVTVEDRNGCTVTVNDTITEPTELTATVVIDSVKCYGDANGKIVITATGGTSPYTYWHGEAQISDTIKDLPAGSYSIKVKDAKGCSYTIDTVVGGPVATLTATLTVDSVKCFEGADGKVVVTAAGGNGGYTYIWSNRSTSDTIKNLTVGTYTVTVTDRKGCELSKDTTVSGPAAAITATLVVDSVKCYGGNDGKIVVTAAGGNGGYTYAWTDDVSSTNIAENLSAGNYTVTITDRKGCELTKDTIVSQPSDSITATFVVDSVKCFGGNDGKIVVTAAGGNGSYTYTWSNSSSSDTIKNLSATSYTVTVTDRKGCTVTKDTTVGQPAATLTATFVVDSVKCFGENTGKIVVTAAGGNGDYTYAWSNSSSSDTIKNLSVGTYTVTITDRKGCELSKDTTVSGPAAAITATLVVDSVKCYGGNDGKIVVTAAGGNGGYTYLWSDNVPTTSDTIKDIPAGNYEVTVTDRKGCEISKDTTVGQPSQLAITFVSDSVKCYGGSTGSIIANPTGGKAPYTYSWSTAPTQTTQTASNIAAGRYTVIVTDANSCTVTKDTTVGQPTELQLTENESAHKDITCHGLSDGYIEVNATGGVANEYYYSWDGAGFGGYNSKNMLAKGEHIIIAKDGNSCVDTVRVTIAEPDTIILTTTPTNLTCFETGDGAISTEVRGGRTPYTYRWNDVQTTDQSERENLSASTYYLTVTDNSGCQALDTITLTQPDYFNVTIDQPTTEICANQTTTYTTTTVGTGFTYQWYKDDGILTDSTSSSISQINIAGEYKIIATQTESGCTKKDSVVLTVDTVPNVQISGDTEICFGGSTTLTASGADSYAWANCLATSADITVSPVADSTFTVVGTNSYGCTASASETVTVNALPSATLTTQVNGEADDNDIVICAKDTVVIAAPDEAGRSYVWKKDGQLISGETSRTLTLSNIATADAGTYTVVVTNTTTSCDSTSDPVTIKVNALPVVTLTEDNQARRLCADSAFHFTATADSVINTYKWSLNGTTFENITNTWRATTAGKYVVDVVDTNGCANVSDTLTVTFDTIPVVTLTEDNGLSTICADSAFHFTATAGYNTYAWTFNNTSIIGNGNTLRATQAGKYAVRVTNGNGCEKTADTLTVTVNALPTVTLSATHGRICADAKDTLTATGATTYEWSPETYLHDYATDKKAFYGAPGATTAYTITVTGTDANGCKNTATADITVDTLPVITVNDPDVCRGGTVTLTANGGTNYTWAPADSLNAPTGSPVDFHSMTAGTYKIVVTGTTTHNCSAVDTATITVNDLPTTEISIVGLDGNKICKGKTAKLAAVGSTLQTYSWTPTNVLGGGETVTTDTVTFDAAVAGTGENVIQLQGTDANGCINTASTTITVDTLPVITLTADRDALCQTDDTVKFSTANGNGIVNYVWTYPTENATVADSTGATLKLKWSAYGEKTVTVNYTDGNGCTAVAAAQKTVTVNQLPNVAITDGTSTAICLGSSKTLEATGANSYVWNNNVGSIARVTVTPIADSTFTVVGTDGNNCKNTASIEVTVNDTVKLVISNKEQTICLGESITKIAIDSANCTLTVPTLCEGLTRLNDTISGAPVASGTYTYNIVATSNANPSCGSKSENINIVVNDTVQLTASYTKDTICLGNAIVPILIDSAFCTLTFPNMPQGLSYNAETHQIEGTITTAGTYNFNIAGASTTGCHAYNKDIAVTLTINDTVKLSSSSDLDQELCLGTAIENIELDTAFCSLTFTPELSTANLSYDAATHAITGTPDSAGTYDFTITATSNNDCDSYNKTLDFKIVVNDTVKLTTATPDNLDQKFCLGTELDTIKLAVENGTLSIIDGSLPDGVTLGTTTDTAIVGTPTETGTFNFKIKATGTACTTSEKTLAVKIVVDTIPSVEILADDETICPEGQQSATLTATAGYTTYVWANGVSSTTNEATVMPTADSTFTVTVTNGNRCKNSASITIGVHTLPIITVAGNTRICYGSTTTLTASSTTATSFEWLNGVGSTPGVTVAPVDDSLFIVKGTDANNCYDTTHVNVIVDSLPNVNLTASVTNTCQKDTITFTANDATGLTYTWKDGTTTVGGNDNEYIFATTTSTATGSHKISVKISDGNQCVKSDTLSVTVNATPVLATTYNRVRCHSEENAYIDLTVTNATASSYSWTSTNTAFSGATTEDIQNLGAGTYYVTVNTADGCSANDSVTIEEPDALTASFNTVSDTLLCSATGKVVVTVEGGTPTYQYEWEHNGSIIPGTLTDTLTIQNLTTGNHEYTVTITDDSACSYIVPTSWLVKSTRIEVRREINLVHGETYVHKGITYSQDGQTFEDVIPHADPNSGCDSAYMYTVHVYGIGFYFADDFDVIHSAYRTNYFFDPDRIGDTLYVATGDDKMFYTYVTTSLDTLTTERVDMKYAIYRNDVVISNGDYNDFVDNFKIASYYENHDAFYGRPCDSAVGEVPSTTFLYQYPSNSTAYYFDYFNFQAFNNMPQKVNFNFSEPGVYTIKFFVEKRNGGSAGQYWGFYNPFIVNSHWGPVWGGRGDNPTSRDTIAARYMTVIVSDNYVGNNPVITNIEDYATESEVSVNTYPNPANDVLNLDIRGMEGITDITITDATGKVVRTYSENLLFNETTLTYNVANFAQGIYFINVRNNDTIITKKFIVTKR